MNNVLKMADYRGKDIIDVCEEIITLVKNGKCQGAAFMIAEGDNHRMGITGIYKINVDLVCQNAAAYIQKNKPGSEAATK